MTISQNTLTEIEGEVDSNYVIEYRPTSKCNYNCYYCTDLHDNSNKLITNNIKNIVRLINIVKKTQRRNVTLYIYGGEPTLHPDLQKTINIVSENMEGDDYIEVQSNLSKNIEWFKRFLSNVNSNRLKISASYHNIHCKSVMTFLKKCVYLKSENILNIVSVMYNSRKNVMKDYELLKNVLGEQTCELAPLIQQIRPNAELDKEIDYFYLNIDDNGQHSFNKSTKFKFKTHTELKSRNQIWRQRLNRFNGYMCSVVLDKLYIDWDGCCYSCVNDMFNEQIPPVFNINKFNSELVLKYYNNTSRLCTHKTCPFDINSRKYEAKA